MKKFLTILFGLACAACASAAEIKLTQAEARDLAAALQALDGYEREVDRGPGNGHAVMRANYAFSSEVRAKLAANLTQLAPIVRAVQDRIDAKRTETALALGVPRLDGQNEIHVYELSRRIKPILAETVTLDLSFVTIDDLNLGKEADGRNPIPTTVLATLNLLRPPMEKK